MFIFKSKQKKTYICFSLNDLLFIGLKWYFPKNLQIRDNIRDNIRILFNKYLIAYHIPSITIISSVGIETNVTSTSPKGTPSSVSNRGDRSNKMSCNKDSDRNTNRMLGRWEVIGRGFLCSSKLINQGQLNGANLLRTWRNLLEL